MNREDIKKLKFALNKINLVNELMYYDNPCLIILDAVMSRSRVYEKTVVPKINYFRENHSEVDTLEKLISEIQKCGSENFAPLYLDYRFKQLGKVILDTAIVFNNNKTKETDLESMKEFAATSKFYQEIQKVKGIGVATARYLAILLNIDTVKPDVHIIKFIKNSLGKKVSQQEAIDLVTAVALEINQPVAIIDHSIWKYMSNINNGDIKSILHNMNKKELREVQKYIDSLLENSNDFE